MRSPDTITAASRRSVVRVCACACIFTYVCARVCMCVPTLFLDAITAASRRSVVCVCVCVCMCMCVHVYVCVCIFAPTFFPDKITAAFCRSVVCVCVCVCICVHVCTCAYLRHFRILLLLRLVAL